MVEVLLLLLAYALMIDWLMREVPVPVVRRAFLRLAEARRGRGAAGGRRDQRFGDDFREKRLVVD